MKAVLMSIQPKWCELIASGKKTVEVRKTRPKIEAPFKVYIYCTQDKRLLHKFDKGERIDDETFFDEHVFVRRDTWIRGHIGNGKVIGEFVCDRIRCEHEIADGLVDIVLESTSCVGARELLEYANGKPLYSWHISDLVIYNKPKELSEFNKAGFGHVVPLKRPPQSWMYVEEEE